MGSEPGVIGRVCPPSTLPDDTWGLRLEGEAQDVGRVALVVGDDEMPVTRIRGCLRCVHFDLVDAVGVVRLEGPHPAGRGHRERASRRRVERQHLGPEVLAFDAATGRAFAMAPPRWVWTLKSNYPDGVYQIEVDTSKAPTDPRDWHFVVADHKCNTTDILSFPFESKPPRVIR